MDAIKTTIRETYGQIARKGGSCCAPGCCAPGTPTAADTAAETAKRLGYSDDDLRTVPEGANLGLGCGNPQAIAALQPGETVLDLGSGGGLDCFLAGQQVGPQGHVIGVDMTADMVELARGNAANSDAANIEFRLGEIEHLPVADRSVDVIVSNCVINLSTDKLAVFREAFRVLRSGGRLAISDVVATAPLPDSIRDDLEAIAGCQAGASLVDELVAQLGEAGFVDVAITEREDGREIVRQWAPERKLENYIVSATIEARRP